MLGRTARCTATTGRVEIGPKIPGMVGSPLADRKPLYSNSSKRATLGSNEHKISNQQAPALVEEGDHAKLVCQVSVSRNFQLRSTFTIFRDESFHILFLFFPHFLKPLHLFFR